MSNSSRRAPFPNVPPPQGSRPHGAYTRFIPREELGPVAAWNPDAFGAAKRESATPPVPPEPTADEWRTQVSAARQAGYQDGYRDGLAALESFKQSHAAKLARQLAGIVDAFDGGLDALHAQIAEAVTRTSVQLARQVLRAELTQHPQHVARVTADAVEAVLLSARHITVHVHPQDLPLVAEGAEAALKARGARLLADAGIERGGCLVESDVGAIDARVATRWAQAAANLGSDEAWPADAPAEGTP